MTAEIEGVVTMMQKIFDACAVVAIEATCHRPEPQVSIPVFKQAHNLKLVECIGLKVFAEAFPIVFTDAATGANQNIPGSILNHLADIIAAQPILRGEIGK